MVNRVRLFLKNAGFEETVQADSQSYAIIFQKSLKASPPEKAVEAVQWCLQTLRTVP